MKPSAPMNKRNWPRKRQPRRSGWSTTWALNMHLARAACTMLFNKLKRPSPANHFGNTARCFRRLSSLPEKIGSPWRESLANRLLFGRASSAQVRSGLPSVRAICWRFIRWQTARGRASAASLAAIARRAA